MRRVKRMALAIARPGGSRWRTLWVAAVRAVPGVRRRKEARRRSAGAAESRALGTVIAPPVLRGGPAAGRRARRGLFLFAVGIVLQLESGLGLGPWDVLSQGIATTRRSRSATITAVSLVVLVIAWALGARLGVGTVANAVLVGSFIDVLLSDRRDRAALRAAALRSASLRSRQASSSSASARACTSRPRSEPGPRDSLMLVAPPARGPGSGSCARPSRWSSERSALRSAARSASGHSRLRCGIGRGRARLRRGCRARNRAARRPTPAEHWREPGPVTIAVRCRPGPRQRA